MVNLQALQIQVWTTESHIKRMWPLAFFRKLSEEQPSIIQVISNTITINRTQDRSESVWYQEDTPNQTIDDHRHGQTTIVMVSLQPTVYKRSEEMKRSETKGIKMITISIQLLSCLSDSYYCLQAPWKSAINNHRQGCIEKKIKELNRKIKIGNKVRPANSPSEGRN